jgi:uncharacterized protein YutE (UPF0331/DUF86 family)
MIDQPKTTRLLERLRAYVAELRRLGAIPADAFLADPDKVGNAKYHFVVAIEACIDLANHVIAAEGFRTPKDNADTFTVLVEHGAVEDSLEQPLRSMARFRNRLVHLYWDVDDGLVCEYLAEDSLSDRERFAKAIADFSVGSV